MLIELTKSQWVKPENIVGVRLLEGSISLIGETMCMPRVSVDLSNGVSVILDCSTNEEASEKVGEIIDMIYTATKG